MLPKTLFLWLAAGAALFAQDQGARVDEFFQQWAKPGTPGASVAVIRDGKLVYAKGYGVANLEYDIPITADTVFEVGSNSKQITAMSIVLLEQDGKLSLEDDIHKYLPELADYSHGVTVRQLLQHTSGIRDCLDLFKMADGRWFGDTITQKQTLDMLFRQRELNFTPGTRGLYSNGGYVLLAEIVSRVSGKPLSMFADERIFQPLGMTRTHFHDDILRIVPGRAYGYLPVTADYLAFPVNTTIVGASGLFTTAADLVKWLDNFRDPRVGGAKAIARMQEMAEVLVPVAEEGSDTPYALGLIIGENRGLRTISHAGILGGYRSYVVWYPDQRLGVAVLTNRSDSRPVVLANRVAAVYLEGQMKPEPAKAAERTFITIDPAATTQFQGVYSAGWQRFEVTQKGPNLLVAELGWDPVEMKPMTLNRFYAANMNAEVEFTAQPGNGMGFKITQEGSGSRSGQRIVVSPFDPGDLEQYPGRYWSDELESQYTVVLRNGTLFAERMQNGGFAMRPVAKDEFNGGGYAVKFTRDRAGAVTSMILRTFRVTGVRFARR